MSHAPSFAGRPGALAFAGRSVTWIFAGVAVISCGCAFAGLSASGWWTDELFTLFLIDHHGGSAEVVRRALTDTQPPAFYLLLHGWSRLVGLGEAPLRGLTAGLAVMSIAVFWWMSRGSFSTTARAWAAAAAATSPLWFVQSQNIRNYSLCFLLMAVMLALALRLRRRTAAGEVWPWASWAGLTVAGALDAATHFYGLLGFGALLLALIASLPSSRLRVALVASGLAVTLGEAAYVRLLVGHTQENFQHLWFRKDAAGVATVAYDVWKLGIGGAVRAAVVGLLIVWAISAANRRTRPLDVRPGPGQTDAAWLAAVCAFVLGALYLGGAAVSLLFAPSLSDRNVLTAAPAAWILLAALYDAALRRLGEGAAAAVGLACAALLVFHAVAIDRGRALSRNEPWRETARYVEALPACRGAVLDVVQPGRFGPDTPFYRMIAQRDFFGRYLADGGARVRPHPAGAFTGAFHDPELSQRLAERLHDPSGCPVLAWAVHDVDTDQAVALRKGMAAALKASPAQLHLRGFSHEHLKGDAWRPQPSGYIIERAGP